MIIGLGIDLVDIARIENMKLLSDFVKKHFSENEQIFFNSAKNLKFNRIANNFAVKEAFSKALGIGLNGFSLNEVEVLRNDSGKPYINLYGNAKKLFEKSGGGNIFVSITDTEKASAAVVIIEG